MRRRELVATIATAAVAGCSSIAGSSRPFEVHEWADATADFGIPYSAVEIEANVDDPPHYTWLVGVFDDGTERAPNHPADAEAYGEHGQRLYSADDVDGRGWLIYHHEDRRDVPLATLKLEERDVEWTR